MFDEAKSVLSFIDFSKISEFECGKFAINTTTKKFYELWNSGLSLDEISIQLNKSVGVVQSKLRLANKYGLCVYDKNLNMKNHQVINMNTPPDHNN